MALFILQRQLPEILVRSLGCRNYTSIYQVAAAAAFGDDPNLPRIQDMRQGEKASAVFTKDEYECRLGKLREKMSENHIGGVVLTSLHNIKYFSGFLPCLFGRNYGLVVTPNDCVTISAGIDAGQPYRRSYGDSITYMDWRNDNYFHTVGVLLSNICGRIGLEYDNVTVENMSKFGKIVPAEKLVDIGELTMRVRMKKSKEEIELIRQGARIADLGGTVVVDALKESVPEFEVAMASTRAMNREIANTYPNAELMDTWTWFQSGINTDGAHNPLTTRKIQKGDILSLNCFPNIDGYYTALERTLFYDSVDDESLRLWEINCQVHEKGISLIKPGAKCCDIANELNEIFKNHGLLKYRTFGYGHSFGVLSHYFGREKALELREDVDTVLEPGMVISMEPMITIPEGKPGAGGYREHDIIILTEDGGEDITGFPYGPEHNIIKSN